MFIHLFIELGNSNVLTILASSYDLSFIIEMGSCYGKFNVQCMRTMEEMNGMDDWKSMQAHIWLQVVILKDFEKKKSPWIWTWEILDWPLKHVIPHLSWLAQNPLCSMGILGAQMEQLFGSVPLERV